MARKQNKASGKGSQRGQQMRKGTTSTNDRETSCDNNASKDAANNPKWHGAGTHYQSAANMSFGYQQGQQIQLGSNLDGTPRTRTVPGIHAVVLESTVGNASQGRDPVNLGKDKIFSDVRRDKSGNTVYDPVDFALYLAAMADLFSFVVWLQRAYGTLWMFDRDNAYFPRAFLELQNINYDDLRDNLEDFRTDLNELIGAINAYPVPAGYTIFDYKVFAYKHYYCEGTSMKDQMYMYMPGSFMQLNQQSSGAWGLLGVNVNSPVNQASRHPAFKAKELIDMGWDMFDAMRGNSDVITMTGDITTRFGSNVITLGQIPEMYKSEVHFDIGVLEQMKNARCVYQPGLHIETPYIVTQNAAKSQLICGIQMLKNDLTGVDNFGNDNAGYGMSAVQDAILNYYYKRPIILTTTTYAAGADLVLDSTRLMVAQYVGDTSGVYLHFGTLVPTFFSVCEINANGTTGRYDYSNLVLVPTSATGASANTIQTALNTIANLSNFRFHPETEYILPLPEGQGVAVLDTNPVFDVDNYTILQPSDVERIHRAAGLAEWNATD